MTNNTPEPTPGYCWKDWALFDLHEGLPNDPIIIYEDGSVELATGLNAKWQDSVLAVYKLEEIDKTPYVQHLRP